MENIDFEESLYIVNIISPEGHEISVDGDYLNIIDVLATVVFLPDVKYVIHSPNGVELETKTGEITEIRGCAEGDHEAWTFLAQHIKKASVQVVL
jgi:hypothetical protein